ncbi:MAG: CarD family transcriptional regulator, partial [Myxococcota bacterium]
MSSSPSSSTPAHNSWDDLDEVSLASHYPIDPLVHHLQAQGRRHGWLTGTDPGVRALILAQLQQRLDRRIVIITPDGKTGRQLAQDLQLYCATRRGHEVLYFPSSDISPYGDISPDRHVTLDRLSALFSLHMEIGGQFVVMPAPALIRRTIPADILLEHADVVQVGMTHISNARLRQILSAGGYTSVSLVEDPGTFAIRGDIVDVWSPFDEHPVRIERWGDEVVELKSFDPQSQRTLDQELRETYLFPVREEIFTDATLSTANARLNALAAELKLPSKKVRQCLDDLRAGFHVLGVEALLPAFYPRLGSLTELLGDDDLIVTLDREGCLDAIAQLWEVREAERERRINEHDDFAFPVQEHYLSRAEVEAWLTDRPQVVSIQRLVMMEERSKGDDPIFEFRTRSNADIQRLRKESQSTETTVRTLASDLLPTWRQSYGRIVVACDTAGVAQRLRQLLQLEEIKVARLQSPITPWPPTPAPAQGPVEVVIRPCSQGFRAPACGLVVVSSRELFGRTGRQARAASGQASRSFQETTAIQSFRDLEVGDHVVHTDFGIARYSGLLRLDVDGIPGDFLLLEYADNDRLYMPVYRLGRVQRYTGADSVRLDKLGTSGWERTKTKVKEKLKELAFDLIHLYARRQTQKGFPFPAPD